MIGALKYIIGIFNIKVTETPAGGGLKTDVETYVADWDEILLSPGYE